MKRMLFAVILVVSMCIIASMASAQVRRTGFVPNTGNLSINGVQQNALGDLWSFLCSKGNTALIFVDNMNDNDRELPGGESTGNLDVVAEVFDSNGKQLAFKDDNQKCSFVQVCGFECPEIEIQCNSDSPRYFLEIRDFGVARRDRRDDGESIDCTGGGGYEIQMSIITPDGQVLSEKSTALGGGPARIVPDFVAEKGGQTGPLLDDEGVPGGGRLTKR